MERNFLGSLHDADLISLGWIAEHALRLDVRSQEGRFGLVLNKVSIVRVVDFGMQNVIAQVWHSRDHLGEDQFLRERLAWATATVDSHSYISEANAHSLIMSLKASQKTMIGLVPSVGADLVAVCERLEVSRV